MEWIKAIWFRIAYRKATEGENSDFLDIHEVMRRHRREQERAKRLRDERNRRARRVRRMCRAHDLKVPKAARGIWL